nr:DUF1707 domain-containing protein [Streptomyces sp. RLB1-33]
MPHRLHHTGHLPRRHQPGPRHVQTHTTSHLSRLRGVLPSLRHGRIGGAQGVRRGLGRHAGLASLPVLRASDAERERVEAQLQHHYAVGRLTLPELEERVAVAYEARTREQLDALLTDLPGEAEEPPSPTHVIDPRLLITLLCTSPPAALAYWLISQRAAHRRGPRPRALGDGPEYGAS